MVLYTHTSLVSLTKMLKKDMFSHLIRGMVGEREQIILTGMGCMEQKRDTVVKA